MTQGRRAGWLGAVAVILVLAAGGASWSSAGTIQGALSYADGTIAGSFSNMQTGVVWAGTATGGRYGTVDLVNETFRVEGLAAGNYYVNVAVSPTTNANVSRAYTGDLSGYATEIQVPQEGTVTQDVDLILAVRFTQPVDTATTVAGSRSACPTGAPTPPTFTLAWEAVPLAVSYELRVVRRSCDGGLTHYDEPIIVIGTSIQISHQQVLDEEFLYVTFKAHSATGGQIGQVPSIVYSDGTVQTLYLYANVDVGRVMHPVNSWFIVQGAHWPGVPPTLWGTDMILTNPSGSEVAALIRFTPRDADGTTTYSQETVNVPAGATVVQTDIVSTLFGQTAAGSFEVTPKTVEVMTRTYTPGTLGGTYGQGYVQIGSERLAYTGGAHTKLGAGGVQKGAFRTNLAFVEVWGEQVVVRVILKDGSGTQLGSKEYTIKPFSNIQINDVVAKLGGPSTLSGGQVEVEVVSGTGRFAGALSVVDQTTDDPTTIPLVPR